MDEAAAAANLAWAMDSTTMAAAADCTPLARVRKASGCDSKLAVDQRVPISIGRSYHSILAGSSCLGCAVRNDDQRIKRIEQ